MTVRPDGKVDIVHVVMPEALVPRRLREALQLLASAAAKDLGLDFEPKVRFFQTLYLDEYGPMLDAEPVARVRELVRVNPDITGPDGELRGWRVTEGRNAQILGTAVLSDPHTIWIRSGEGEDLREMPHAVFHELEHLRQYAVDLEAELDAAVEEAAQNFDVEQYIADWALDAEVDAEEIAKLRALAPDEVAEYVAEVEGDCIWEEVVRAYFSPEATALNDAMSEEYADTCMPDVATGAVAEAWATILAGSSPFTRAGTWLCQDLLLLMALDGEQTPFLVEFLARRSEQARKAARTRWAKQAAKQAA